MSMTELVKCLENRRNLLDNIASHGIIPGQFDSYDLEQLIGRIKELNFVMNLICKSDSLSRINKIVNDVNE